MGKKKAAGDAQICRKKKFGKWKCKNVSSDNKLRFCENHYKGFEDFIRKRLTKKKEEKLKNGIGNGEGAGAGCSATGVETRGSKLRKEVTDETGGIQPPSSGSGELDFTDSLTENPSLITSNKLRKKNKEKKLHPDEHRCCQTGRGWRCKNFRMSHAADASVPKTNYCEKHYNYYAQYYKNRKKRNGDGGGAGYSTATGPVEIRRLKTVTEEAETGKIQPATSDDTCTPKIGTKRKKVSGDLNSSTKIGEPGVELESLEHYKSKCFELSVELEKQKMELDKKNVEHTTLQGKYAELETKKTAAEDENAVKYWRNKCSDLESLVLKMNPTMRCEVSRVSNLDS